jgi:hypothetical protein
LKNNAPIAAPTMIDVTRTAKHRLNRLPVAASMSADG